MANSSGHDVKLDVLMHRISDHLDSLAARVLEVEEAIGKSIASRSETQQDQATITRLQSLDFLRQSLEDLALLSCYVSKNTPNVNEIVVPVGEFSHGLKLDVTRHVAGSKGAEVLEGRREANGDVDLF